MEQERPAATKEVATSHPTSSLPTTPILMTKERTLSIIKPDAVEKKLTGKIIAHLQEVGFDVLAMRQMHLTTAQAEGFYAVHRERPFFRELVTFMTRSPVVVMVLEAENQHLRSVLGQAEETSRQHLEAAAERSSQTSAENGSRDRNHPQALWSLQRRERDAWLGRTRDRTLRDRILLPRIRATVTTQSQEKEGAE